MARTVRSSRRLRMTRSGVAVTVGSAALVGSGLGLGWPTLTGLGVAGFTALAAALGFVAASPRLSARRDVTPDRTPVGEPAWSRLEIVNRGRLASASFDAVDELAGQPHDDGRRLAVPVTPIPPGERRELRYPIGASHRGLVTLGPLRSDRRDPLGLLARSATLAGTTRLWIHPRIHQVRPLPVGMVPDFEGRLDDQVQRGSLAFSSLREYQPGDDPRHIHWRTTARTGSLVVHEHVDTHEPTVSIVLDTRTSSLEPEAFEDAVEVVASIVAASSRVGHAVSFEALGEDKAAVSQAGGYSVLDRLAALRQVRDDGSRDDHGLLGLLQLIERAPPGGSLVVVTGDEPGLLTRLATQRRRFGRVVLVVVGGSDAGPLTRRPGFAVLRAACAADAVRKWNQFVCGPVATLPRR